MATTTGGMVSSSDKFVCFDRNVIIKKKLDSLHELIELTDIAQPHKQTTKKKSILAIHKPYMCSVFKILRNNTRELSIKKLRRQNSFHIKSDVLYLHVIELLMAVFGHQTSRTNRTHRHINESKRQTVF